MEPAARILLNTMAQYTRAIITTCLNLYSVRLVLAALGTTDYGIYTLVAGVVAMLGFVTNAMVITTQRHLSYSFGQPNTELSRKTFSCSMLIHLCIGTSLAIVLMALKMTLFTHVLCIPPERLNTASWIYVTTIGMMLLSFMEAPFKALFIARENIIYISFVEVTDGIMRLLLVILLLDGSNDPLRTYGNLMLGIWCVRFLLFSLWPLIRYQECSPRNFLTDINSKSIKAFSEFAGWTTYSMGCVIARNQGLNVLFNRSFMSTVLCASYGIALQVVGGAQIVSTSLLNAINPQIMQAEGAGNRTLMLHRAEQESRISSAMLATIFVPAIVEMENILQMWLSTAPPKAAFLCRCLLLAQIIDQSTYGLHTANQAIGHIRNYTLLMYTPKLLILPLAWLAHRMGGGVFSMMGMFLTIELAVAFMRIPYLSRHGQLDSVNFTRSVFPPLLFIIALQGGISMVLHAISTSPFNTLCALTLSIACGMTIMWQIVLSNSERHKIWQILFRKKA